MRSTVTPAYSKSIFKDDRKVSVGDCALFKQPQDSPPSIGIIRWLTLSKENNVQVVVNWLYRPAEIKLGKGVWLDAAPNEIFYSFRKDKIPAGSLLHPCKVAFLPSGVDLPSGTSSFICRRVYDIESNSLSWLTDKDYTDERQEEVDQLLDQTRKEMHAMVQMDGRSSKSVSGPTSTSQIKSGSDNGQNVNACPSQVKGKKRERGDQSSDPVKRERSSRMDDGAQGHYKVESYLKSEIAKITEKGGLVDSDGVEKLVQLMRPDRMERKIDLIRRSMLAGVMAATEKFDCLNRFVQLRGLTVLDEWLQDIHKGKIGDGTSSKEGDKNVEEFLLVVLRALDKLPVNLHALQMCNIGKSVNHLRSHKNSEIQRKVRSLVDTWKKSVEAEMNIIDAKSGSTQTASSWSSKSRHVDASHGGNRNLNGSDVSMKSSLAQVSSSKATSGKSSHGECNARSASSSPGPIKSAASPSSSKESHPRTSVAGTSDVPATREDKSSCSNQSHNYYQSISGKEDGKSSSSVNRSSSGGSRHRRGVNSFPGTSPARGQRETSSSRSQRNTSFEKSMSTVSGEKFLEMPVTEGISHKIIVKIPNPGRGPAQPASGGPLGEPSSLYAQVSSPMHSEKNYLLDHSLREKSDADMNIESCQSNEFKDFPTASEDGGGSPATLPDEEQSTAIEDSKKSVRGFKGIEVKTGKLVESSFSPMNALIESCVKYSEANSSLSLEDDVGMNLLASVAAGEMCKSDLASHSESPESTPSIQETCIGEEVKSKSSPEARNNEIHGDATGDNKEQILMAGSLQSEDGLHPAKEDSFDATGGPCTYSRAISNPQGEINKKLNEIKVSASLSHPGTAEKIQNAEFSVEDHGEMAVSSCVNIDSASDRKMGGTDVLVIKNEDKDSLVIAEEGGQALEVASAHQICAGDGNDSVDQLNSLTNVEQKPSAAAGEMFERKGRTNDNPQEAASCQKTFSEDDVEVSEADGKDAKANTYQSEKQNTEEETRTKTVKDQNLVASCPTSLGKTDHTVANILSGQNPDGVTFSEKEVPAAGHVLTSRELKDSYISDVEEDKKEEHTSVVETAAPCDVETSHVDTKMKFDLNEGFDADDGKYGEESNLLAPGSTALHAINLSPFAVSSLSCGLPTSITVAAAAKGPFVPPEDLLKNRGELGWKGSAATSAFRPAEPRKATEIPPEPSLCGPDTPAGGRGRAPLDFDLNVPDERILEDLSYRDSALAIGSISNIFNDYRFQNQRTGSAPLCGSGGLDLDLNRADDANEMVHCSAYDNQKQGAFPAKLSGGLPMGDIRRDFDLNDGPGIDDVVAEQSLSHQSGKGLPLQLPNSGFRVNNVEIGNFSSWFPPGNNYSTVPIPSMLPDRGDQPFSIIPPGAPPRIFGPAGGTPVTPEVCRASVLSSSTAVPFPSAPFQYPVFPFGTTFSLPTASIAVGTASYADASSGGRLFAPANSQLLGPVGAFPSQFPRPYVVSISDAGSSTASDNNRKWIMRGLDLNSGPGAMDTGGREENLPSASRQLSVANSQVLSEEQAKMYSVSGSILKRKEPEGGLGNENFRYKQSPWQ